MDQARRRLAMRVWKTGGIMKKCWTAIERQRLLDLRDVQKLSWDEIPARMPGRSKSACLVQYYHTLRDRSAAKRMPPRTPRVIPAAVKIAPSPIKPPAIVVRQVPASAPGRTVSTSALRYHAELLQRVAHAGGLTAGLLGDPPPGRSALDQKR